MVEFRDIWILILVPVIGAALVFLRRRQGVPGLRFPTTVYLAGLPGTWKTQWPRLAFILRLLSIGLFVAALAGPRSVLNETVSHTEGVDIILAIDTSGSMAAEDFQIQGKRYNRLEVVKRVVGDFVKARPYDRIGVVAFAGVAYTICPLTVDHAWLLNNLERVDLKLIQKDGTAVGSAVSSSLLRLKDSKAKSKVIVLLTDGINNAGKVDPLSAAQAAKTMGVKIYTIGAGTKGKAPFPVEDIWGRTRYQMVKIDIDEETLKKIAETSRGEYFRATDTDSLKDIYREIDKLEKTRIETVGYKEYKELFNLFLLAGLAILLIEQVLSRTILLRIP